MNKLAFVFCLVSLIATPALAIESPSLELGKTLFESSELGTKGRSCSSCHAEGKGLELIGDFNDEELKDIINACIRDALGGQLISVESQEMLALMSYVRTFQKPAK